VFQAVAVDASWWLTALSAENFSRGILIAVIWGGMRGWFVFGPTHDRVCRQNDEYQALIMEFAGIARGAMDAAKRARRDE
jgi:hypothetical protein